MNSKTEYANFGWLTHSIARLQGIAYAVELARAADQLLNERPAWVKDPVVARLNLYVSNRLAGRPHIKVPNGH